MYLCHRARGVRCFRQAVLYSDHYRQGSIETIKSQLLGAATCQQLNTRTSVINIHAYVHIHIIMQTHAAGYACTLLLLDWCTTACRCTCSFTTCNVCSRACMHAYTHHAHTAHTAHTMWNMATYGMYACYYLWHLYRRVQIQHYRR